MTYKEIMKETKTKCTLVHLHMLYISVRQKQFVICTDKTVENCR